jgi:hypothetical protein
MTENDLEILEGWLDGELPDEQSDQLRRRIAEEPQLAQAVDRLRSERQMRSQCWQVLEPSDAEVETLIANVRRDVQQDEIWNLRLGALRKVSGVAASIAVVFMAGWLTHSRLRVGGVDTFATPTSPQIAPQPVASNFPNNNNRMQLQPGNLDFVSAPIASNPSGIQPANYQLQIRDNQGHVWVQPLDRLDDPNKFMANMGRFQSQEQQQRQPSDPILVDHQQP